MNEFLGAFWRAMLFLVPAVILAVVLVQFAGFPPDLTPLAAIVLGSAASVAARRSVCEPVLRHAAHRPRRTMTPEDYRRTQELERELGWEPSEPCMPVEVPAARRKAVFRPDTTRPVTRPAGYPRHSVRSTSGTISSAGSARLYSTPALSGSGSLSAEATWADDVAREETIGGMKPGLVYYTVPWAMSADEDGTFWLNARFSAGKQPCGTQRMRVVRSGDEYHVWRVPGESYPRRHLSGPWRGIRVAVLHERAEQADASEHFTPDDIALMRSGAYFLPGASVTLPSGKRMTGTEIQRWIENDQAQQWIEKDRWEQG